MMAAPLGDDVFGTDPSVNALQEKIAALLGFEAALFVPTGTQSNFCGILSHCQRGDEYIVGQMAHCYRWEGGGAAVLGSVQPQPLNHQPDGTLALTPAVPSPAQPTPAAGRTRNWLAVLLGSALVVSAVAVMLFRTPSRQPQRSAGLTAMPLTAYPGEDPATLKSPEAVADAIVRIIGESTPTGHRMRVED